MQETDDSGRKFWSLFQVLRKVASDTPEGKGGVSAISGFAFQFIVSLEAMIENANESDKVKVFLELLSDLVVARDGRIEVTQIKLTLSSSATGKGIEELWKVHQHALAQTPGLIPSLRYRVLGNKTATKSGIGSVEHRLKTWRPSGPFDQGQFDAFRDKLSAVINVNPRLTLAASLVNLFAIEDPFAQIERWIGKLIGVESHAQLTAQAEEIAVEVGALDVRRREVEASFRLWSASDRPPVEVLRETNKEKWVLTGQIPSRSHLREGRFAPRRVYAEIAEKAEEWLGSGTVPTRERSAAFWIAGRSGSGKSVALLHLLSALHDADSSRIIVWLDDAAGRIGEAVRWCRPFLREGYQVIIAADDPFTSAKRVEVTNAVSLAKVEMEALKELAPNATHPVLILCGPDEQAEAFSYEMSDFVETLSYNFPHETRNDIEELRAWYRLRTGGTKLALKETEGVLIVQLFFEWATGEKLESFSRRLERRLKDFSPGLFEMVAKILAVNRLYALYPAAAINAELRSAPEIEAGFNQLATADGHFSLDFRTGGYRLTHPHLADAIYRTWFGKPRDTGFRKAHICQAIEAALAFGSGPSQRLAPLWAISRLASPHAQGNLDTALRIDLIRQDLALVLPEIFGAHFSTTAEPLVMLPVWAALDTALQLGLAPSPVNVLINIAACAPADAQGLRLACSILLAVASEQGAARDTVRQILLKYGEWNEWPKVMLVYVKRYGLVELLPQLESFVKENPYEARALVFTILSGDMPGDAGSGRSIVQNWFQPDDPYLEFQAGVLSAVVEAWGCAHWMRTIAVKFLTGFPGHPSWSHLWEMLPSGSLDETTEVDDLGRQWIFDNNLGKQNWDRVWEKLWEYAPRDKDLRQVAVDWLKAQPEHGSWQFTWQKLWEATPADADLRQVAVDWLKAQPEHGSWQFTWQKLWEATPADADLRQIAVDWLKAQPEDPFWAFTWHELWKAARANDKLRNIASDWLGTKRRYANLVRRCLTGATSTAFSYEWSDRWKKSWQEAKGDISKCQSLFNEALLTLSDTLPELGGWTSVWSILWDNCGKDPAAREGLRELAVEWLGLTDPEHPRWATLWRSLWNQLPENEPLRSEAITALSSLSLIWLTGPTPRHRWPDVWLALWHDQVHLHEHLSVMVRFGARSEDFEHEPDTEVAACMQN